MSAIKTRRGQVLACIMLAMFIAAIEATIVATAMPAIVARLGGFAYYSWVFSGFLIAQSVTAPVFGKLADLYGRRSILIGGLVVFMVGSLLCGFAWSMTSLVLFRLLQGVGAGSIVPVAMTVTGDLYTPEERTQIQGYLSSVWVVAAVLGPIAGGTIVQHLAWQWIFWINVPLAALTIAGLLAFLAEDRQHSPHRIDYGGALLFAVAMTGLLIVLAEAGGTVSWTSPEIIVSALAFLIATPLFVWVERRAREPMIPLDLLVEPAVSSANWSMFFLGAAFMGFTSFLPFYVQGVMGRSPIVAGFAITTMSVTWPIASFMSRWFFRWFGLRHVSRLGGVLVLIGALFFISLQPQWGPVWPAIGSGITGFGMGLISLAGIVLTQGSVDWSKRGSATALFNFARTLGSTLGVAILGTILNASLHHGAVSSGADPKGFSSDRIRELLENPGATGDAGFGALHHVLENAVQATFWGIVVFGVLTFLVTLTMPDRQLSELTSGGAPPPTREQEDLAAAEVNSEIGAAGTATQRAS